MPDQIVDLPVFAMSLNFPDASLRQPTTLTSAAWPALDAEDRAAPGGRVSVWLVATSPTDTIRTEAKRSVLRVERLGFSGVGFAANSNGSHITDQIYQTGAGNEKAPSYNAVYKMGSRAP